MPPRGTVPSRRVPFIASVFIAATCIMPPFRPPAASEPTPRPRALLLASGLAWAVFGWLALAVVQHGGLGWDAPLLNFWHQHATPAGARFVSFTLAAGVDAAAIKEAKLKKAGGAWILQ